MIYLANLQSGFTKKTQSSSKKISESCRNGSGKQSAQTSKDTITALIPYTVPHNHPYVSSYKPEISTAATYVGMVMWDGVGY